MNDQQRRVRAAALQAARSQGCTCRPEAMLTTDGHVWRAQVAHDDWCPVLRSHEAAVPGVPTGPIVFVPPGWKAPER